MPKMNDAQINHELDQLSREATGNNSTLIAENEELLSRYEADYYGDELPERSQVVSNDCMDVVESDMPTLARVFLGPGEILKFRPNGTGEDRKKEAEDKTKYVNWQIREQPWSFEVLHGFIKNAEIQKVSVVKYFIEEDKEIEEIKKTGLTDEEIASLQADLEKEENVISVEIDREEETDDPQGENDIVFKVERCTKMVKIINVPLERFRMTKNTESKDKAPLVGDVAEMTRGELVAMGIDRETVSKIESISASNQIDNTNQTGSTLPDQRDADEGGTTTTAIIDSWASEVVEVEEFYPLLDVDDDGIAERRRILRSAGGDKTILKNEVFNHVPYAVMSAIMMPHKAIGKSRVEITAPTARVKTSILRGMQDNIYAVNNPRIGANTLVNMDDLLVMRPNGIIRMLDETPPGNNLFPIEVPFIGDKALMVLQYWDHSRAQTTGSLLPSQGLQADDLGAETATRFKGVESDSDAKLELVARVMAETGFRQLFEGVAWLDSNFQNYEVEVEILGEELKVKPSDWKFKQSVVSKVGLGAGDDEKILQTLTALWTLHQQLQQTGSVMTDEIKRYNVLKNMVKASGLPDVAEYFNDPTNPAMLSVAQAENLTRLVQELQAQVQQLQNPLAEAEKIKQQGNLIKAQSDAQLQITKLQEDQRQFNEKMAVQLEQFQKTFSLQLTETIAKYGQPRQLGATSNEQQQPGQTTPSGA